MLRLFKHFLITALFVSHSAFANTRDVVEAKDLYLDLLSSKTKSHEVERICSDINYFLFNDRNEPAKKKFSKGNKEVKEDLKQFLNIISTIDIEKVIANQDLDPVAKKEYLHQLKNRLVTLSFSLSKNVSDKKFQLGKDAVLLGFLEGVFLGGVMYMTVVMNDTLTYAFLGKVEGLAMKLIGIGVAAAGAYNLGVTAMRFNNLNEFRNAFDKIVETNIKNLKGSELDKTVNALE